MPKSSHFLPLPYTPAANMLFVQGTVIESNGSERIWQQTGESPLCIEIPSSKSSRCNTRCTDIRACMGTQVRRSRSWIKRTCFPVMFRHSNCTSTVHRMVSHRCSFIDAWLQLIPCITSLIASNRSCKSFLACRSRKPLMEVTIFGVSLSSVMVKI